MNDKILMGQMPESFSDNAAQSITFCVTEECNLRCKYCYMQEKNSFNKLDFETAKKAVDFFLSSETQSQSVIWDFIGGEPTLEIELIDNIVDYIKYKMFVMHHPWFDNYMISIGTNGLLYGTDSVQKFIKKNKNHLSISITIDGTKAKHDLQRVYCDGTGSYEDVVKNIPLWLSQFPNATTKVTFAREDLCYLKESIIHLWEMGLKIIPANIVFEDVWHDGDEKIYEQQLKELADYIIENNLWEEYSVRFFDPSVGFPLSRYDKETNNCGVGKMVAVDCSGKLYPCIRFLDFCYSSKKPVLCIGNIVDGYDLSKIKAFSYLNIGVLNDGD